MDFTNALSPYHDDVNSKIDKSKDIQKKYHPLPDFMPSSLFEELGLSEVNLIIPQAR
mgnify:CR=1 FL=1